MRYFVFAIIGAIIGVLTALIQSLISGYNEAEQITIECEPTDMYGISAGRKIRIYDCGKQ